MMLRSLPAGFRRQAKLEAEIIALRHQLTVLQRTPYPKRLLLNRADRWFWVWLSRLWSGWRSALIIVKPQLSSVGTVEESSGIGPGRSVTVDQDGRKCRRNLPLMLPKRRCGLKLS